MNTDDTKSQPLLRRLWQSRFRNWAIAGAFAASAAIITTSLQDTETRQAAALILAQPELGALPVIPANMRWGFALDEFHLFEDELRYGDVLGEKLVKEGLPYPTVAQLVENAKGVFAITSMRVGKKLNFLSREQGLPPAYMVYEPSPYEYVVFHLEEPFKVERIKRNVVTGIKASSGVLETNFWQALTDNGLNDELADGMIDVLSSSVDFYHQKVGDRFKVVYEQHYVEGEAVGTGKIIAAVYEREGKEYYAFNFEKEGEKTNYFDFDGRPARKAFLKAPVKFSRISSRYSLNRLHPILGYRRPHFGTDYAAPYGTPIIAVAEGVVTEAAHRGGNGIYVKIRHDGAYESQYLHMRSYAKGIRPGTRVAQGQTIGYVGSTGLATGPHVCFRFWKNGRQVDHLRLNLPQPKPIEGVVLEAFKVVRDRLIKQLGEVPYRTREEIFRKKAEMEQRQAVNP
ncbi:MAG: M23 family metallopeptidase [Saprospirales bacterium]|nr:M23 family metallopeptidase [Saprospirales bacterium]MBK8920343.1 M23 family metallopeptidase [Saprospirales bacterium]